MKVFGMDAKVILVSFGVALALLFAGREVVTRTSISVPLERTLRPMQEVRSYSIEQTSYGRVLNLELGEVDDLRETMKKVQGALTKISGGNDIEIRIVDSRDEVLSDVFHRMHFTIHEAIATGSFADMAREAESLAEAAELSYVRVVVDECNVYVTLRHGHNALYEVVPRGRVAVAEAPSGRAGVRVW
ncbi:MAG: hypothetical protein NUW23_11920 [Firmicutes bacterium]|nr:hypothetical protein [Bacillota bacterium]